ncbi:Outer membrane protein (porin) [Halopseudomonas salegens]|uniref:Outer membrane protein (Porin) n=2 Tax=Halopseudomonas salegens TaxID=1434072 RepID=A0A1H2F6S8_9GAMM|nr:Outer membrane protein (porin) [Halopseudomonas salegens]
MKKKLLAVVIGAAAAMPMMASADVSIYGRVHMSLDHLDNGNDYKEVNVSSNSSRLGFRGSREVGDITAFFQIEQQIDFNEGTSSFAGRDTFAGLRGGFGSVRLGQFDTPFKKARGPANLFGDQVGDMRNLTRFGNARFDERTPNTFHYATPDMGGFGVNIAYSVHEGKEAIDGADGDALSTSLTYKQGPVDTALAYEKFEADTSRGERDAVRFAIGYKVVDAVKVVGFFQTVDYEGDTPAVNDALTSDTWGLGADFKIAPSTYIRGMWMQRDSDADDTQSDLYAFGVEHRLDSALRVYANYAWTKNDDNVAVTPWSQARSASPNGSAGDSAKGLSAGLRYDF